MLAGSTTQGVGSADSFLRSLRVSLLVTGTFRLALAAGDRGQSRRLWWNEMGVWQEHWTQPSRSRAAGKFRAVALSMMC